MEFLISLSLYTYSTSHCPGDVTAVFYIILYDNQFVVVGAPVARGWDRDREKKNIGSHEFYMN